MVLRIGDRSVTGNDFFDLESVWTDELAKRIPSVGDADT